MKPYLQSDARFEQFLQVYNQSREVTETERQEWLKLMRHMIATQRQLLELMNRNAEENAKRDSKMNMLEKS